MGCQKNPEVEKDRHLTSMGEMSGSDGVMTVPHVEFYSFLQVQYVDAILSNNNSYNVVLK